MSLRVKSLIAAFLLVVGVTATLSFINEGLFADSVGKIIEEQLQVSTNTLMHSAKMAEDKAATTLRLNVIDSNFVSATVRRKSKVKGETGYRKLGDDFKPFIKDWLKNTDFDVSVAFYDSYIAELRQLEPTVLAKYEELTACSFHAVDALVGKTKKSKSFHRRILDDEKFAAFIDKSYSLFHDDYSVTKASEVIAVDHAVYLVVVTPLIEFLQSDDGPVGMAVVMKELSVSWANEQLNLVNEAQDINKLQLIVHADQQALSHTLGDHAVATSTLDKLSGVNIGLKKYQLGDEFERHIAYVKPFGENHGPGLVLLKNFDKELNLVLSNVRQKVLWVAIVLTVMGVMGAYMLANTAVTRVNTLADLAHKVRDGDFSQTVTLKGNDEITRLGEAFNNMNKGLKALGLYTDPALALGVVQGDLKIEVDEVEGSIYFSDIANFTSISEKLGSKQLVEQLNEYFTVMGEVIKQTEGYLDKFIGDSIMAFWGKPLYKGDDFSLKACEAALACRDMEDKLEIKWKVENKMMFYQRIGIASGECIVGNIGSKDKKNFTVIGNYVNLASRLEGANKFYGTRILIDAATAEKAQDLFLVREVDQICLKGKSISMRVFELLAQKIGAETELFSLVTQYSEALACYRNRDFYQANAILIDILEKHPGDGPSCWLKKICDQLELQAPKDDWEAITLASGK